MLMVVEFVVVILDLGGGMFIRGLIGARRIPFLGCMILFVRALTLYWEWLP